MDLPKIRVLILDRYPLTRAGTRMLIESRTDMEVLCTDEPSKELLEAIQEMRPDVVVFNATQGNPLDLLAELTQKDLKVIVISREGENRIHHEVVRLGASGLVMKEQTADTLLNAIEKVHSGEVWVSRTIMAAVLHQMLTPPEEPSNVDLAVASLTEREMEVIEQVSRGLKNQEIAARLHVSESTIRHRLTSIYSKLGVTDRLSLLVFAYQHQLVTLPT